MPARVPGPQAGKVRPRGDGLEVVSVVAVNHRYDRTTSKCMRVFPDSRRPACAELLKPGCDLGADAAQAQ